MERVEDCAKEDFQQVLSTLTDTLDSLASFQPLQPPLPKLTKFTSKPRPPTSSNQQLIQPQPHPTPHPNQRPPFQPNDAPYETRYPTPVPIPPTVRLDKTPSPSVARRTVKQRSNQLRQRFDPISGAKGYQRRGVIADACTSRIASAYSDDQFLGLQVEEITHKPGRRRLRRRRRRRGGSSKGGCGEGSESGWIWDDCREPDVDRIPWEMTHIEQVHWDLLESSPLLSSMRVVTLPISCSEKAAMSATFLLQSYDIGVVASGQAADMTDEKWVKDDHTWCALSKRKEGKTRAFVLQPGLQWRECDALSYDKLKRQYCIQMLDDGTMHSIHRVFLRFLGEDPLTFFARVLRAAKCREIAIDLWKLEQYHEHAPKPRLGHATAHTDVTVLARILLLISARSPSSALEFGDGQTPARSQGLAGSAAVPKENHPNPVMRLLHELRKLLLPAQPVKSEAQTLVDTVFTSMLPDNMALPSSKVLTHKEMILATLQHLYPQTSEDALRRLAPESKLHQILSEILTLHKKLLHEAYCAYAVRLFVSADRLKTHSQRLHKLSNRISAWARPHLTKEHHIPDPRWRLERVATSMHAMSAAREKYQTKRISRLVSTSMLRSDLLQTDLFEDPNVIKCIASIHAEGIDLGRLLQRACPNSDMDLSSLLPLVREGETCSKRYIERGKQQHAKAMKMGLGVEWIELTALTLARTFHTPNVTLLRAIDLRMESHLIGFLRRSIAAWLASCLSGKWTYRVGDIQREGLRERCTARIEEAANDVLLLASQSLELAKSLPPVSSIVAGISSVKPLHESQMLLPDTCGLYHVCHPLFTMDGTPHTPPEGMHAVVVSLYEAMAQVHAEMQTNGRQLLRELEPVFHIAAQAESVLESGVTETFSWASRQDIAERDLSMLSSGCVESDPANAEYYLAMSAFVQRNVQRLDDLCAIESEAKKSVPLEVRSGLFVLSLARVREDLLEAFRCAERNILERLIETVQQQLRLSRAVLEDIQKQFERAPSCLEEVEVHQKILGEFEEKIRRCNAMLHFDAAQRLLHFLESRWIRLPPEVNELAFSCQRMERRVMQEAEEARRKLTQVLLTMYSNVTESAKVLSDQAQQLKSQVFQCYGHANCSESAAHVLASQQLRTAVDGLQNDLSIALRNLKLCRESDVGEPLPDLIETNDVVELLDFNVDFLVELWVTLEDVRQTKSKLLCAPLQALNQPLLESKLRGKTADEETLKQTLDKLVRRRLEMKRIRADDGTAKLLQEAIVEATELERIWPLARILHNVSPSEDAWKEIGQGMDSPAACHLIEQVSHREQVTMKYLLEMGILEHDDAIQAKCARILKQRHVQCELDRILTEMGRWDVRIVPFELEELGSDLFVLTDASNQNATSQQNQSQLIHSFTQGVIGLMAMLCDSTGVQIDCSGVASYAAALDVFQKRLALIESARRLLLEAESRELCEKADETVLAARRILERCFAGVNRAKLTFRQVIEVFGEHGSSPGVGTLFVPDFDLLAHVNETLQGIAYD